MHNFKLLKINDLKISDLENWSHFQQNGCKEKDMSNLKVLLLMFKKVQKHTNIFFVNHLFIILSLEFWAT